MKMNTTGGLKSVGYSELIRRYGLEVMPHYTKSFTMEAAVSSAYGSSL